MCPQKRAHEGRGHSEIYHLIEGIYAIQKGHLCPKKGINSLKRGHMRARAINNNLARNDIKN